MSLNLLDKRNSLLFLLLIVENESVYILPFLLLRGGFDWFYLPRKCVNRRQISYVEFGALELAQTVK